MAGAARERAAGIWVAVAALLAGAGFAWGAEAVRHGAVAPPVLPRPTPLTQEYVTSDACRACHPGEYASWHRSFHRSMTQAATAVTVLAPDASLPLDGATYTIARRGDEVWATWPGGPSLGARLELTTGSHHYQAYWTQGKQPGTLDALPLVYLLPEARWIPRRDAFLEPPGQGPTTVRWASGCIQCHATAGRPGRDPRAGFDTDAAELGIACEACHGPGAAHVAKYRSPLARYRAHARRSGPGAEAAIVDPARLFADRASMVCGRCHAFSLPRDEQEWWRRGDTRVYRPGDDLSAARVLIDRSTLLTSEELVEADAGSLFWPDGAVRVGGREYNGLVRSACFLEGKGARALSCLSCHAMHDSEPAGQIAHGKEGDGACLSCHASIGGNVPAHTHHAAGSPGSACVDCHMPPTTYALLKAIPSHTIDRPSVRREPGSRPVACNLCHLGRTLAWTERELRGWTTARPSESPAAPGEDPLEQGEPEEPAALAWLLSGDAAQRVVAAAAFGSKGALATTRGSWPVRALARALEDPYAAVRLVAARSLRARPGFDDVVIDPEAGPAERARLRHAVVERALGVPEPGAPTDAAMDALVAQKDTRAVLISE